MSGEPRSPRVVGDAGTRTESIPGVGLVVYFGMKLDRAPEGDARVRMLAWLDRTRPRAESRGLSALIGDVLWIASLEVGGEEPNLGNAAVARARTRAAQALEAAAGTRDVPAAEVAAAGATMRRESVTSPYPSGAPAAAPVPASAPAATPAPAMSSARKEAEPAPRAAAPKKKGRLVDPDV